MELQPKPKPQITISNHKLYYDDCVCIGIPNTNLEKWKRYMEYAQTGGTIDDLYIWKTFKTVDPKPIKLSEKGKEIFGTNFDPGYYFLKELGVYWLPVGTRYTYRSDDYGCHLVTEDEIDWHIAE